MSSKGGTLQYTLPAIGDGLQYMQSAVGGPLSIRSEYTLLAVVSRARKTLRVSTTATIAQISAVSSKEGAVIGAVLRLGNIQVKIYHKSEMDNYGVSTTS
jgi:hypothetical protein